MKRPHLPIENLEFRRLLAADPASLVADGFEPIEWQGETVYARPGQWVASLDGTPGGPGKSVRAINAALARAGAAGVKALRHLDDQGNVLIHADRGQSATQVGRAMGRAKELKLRHVEPDFALWTAATPANDTYYAGYQYGLNNAGQTGGLVDADIDAPEAWDLARGDGSVVVGVIDSGVDYSHPDLAGNMWRNPREVAGNGIDDDGNGYRDDVYGWDFANNDGDPMDDGGHGTHVAGTIAAVGNNGAGVAGVAWNAKIMALKFIGAAGTGSLSGALGAIDYATKMRQSYGVNVRVTNNSWGGGGYSTSLRDAISRSASAGILFVAAAGNGGADGVGDDTDLYPEYPAAYAVDNVLAVAATDHADRLAGFSNFGATSVDLAAPGVNIASTMPGGSYGYMSGTSMATPHVAGAAALAWSYNPSATYQTVRTAIMNGVDKLSGLAGKTATGGRLNAHKTLSNMGATPLTAPAAPTALSATAVSGSRIDLTWSDKSSNEDGFKLERSTDGVNFAQFATVGAGVTTYSDTGRAPSTTYSYRVRAYNAAGNSAYSGVVSAQTLAQAINLAAGKPAVQSSTGWEGVAARAADGNTDGNYSNNSVTHTQLEGQGWWQVDLGAASRIDSIEVWNRTDLAPDRLQNFYVLVSETPFSSGDLATARAQVGVSSHLVSASPTPATSLNINRDGRYVRVQLAGTDYLSLAEVKVVGTAAQAAPAAPSGLSAAAAAASAIDLAWADASTNEDGFQIERSSDGVNFSQIATVAAGVTRYADVGLSASTSYTYRVRAFNAAGQSPYSGTASSTTQGAFSTPVNLAVGKAAAQSSTGWGGDAARAVDGDTNGDYSNGSVTHTEAGAQNWWQVDLGASGQIDLIEVWNRTDLASERLSDFYVFVSDSPFASGSLADTLAQPGVSAYHVAGVPRPSASVSVGRTGRYVRVQLSGSGYLSLAEVKVLGRAAGSATAAAYAAGSPFSSTPLSAESLLDAEEDERETLLA